MLKYRLTLPVMKSVLFSDALTHWEREFITHIQPHTFTKSKVATRCTLNMHDIAAATAYA